MSTEEHEPLEGQAPEIEPELEEKNQEPEPELELVPPVEPELPAPAKKAKRPADKLISVTLDPSRLKYRAGSKNSMSVRVLQAALEDLGYSVGTDRRGWLVDGTVQALEAFQSDHGLPVSGEATLETLEGIFSASTRYHWER